MKASKLRRYSRSEPDPMRFVDGLGRLLRVIYDSVLSYHVGAGLIMFLFLLALLPLVALFLRHHKLSF